MTTKRRWAGYLDIPEGESGDWSIIHKKYEANHTFSTATFRTAIIGGQRSRSIEYNSPTTFHQLCEGGGVWMSDWPIEQAQCDVNLKRITGGRVLVGGLGLGLCATILARRPSIEQVTVVEKSVDVVKLVAQHLRVPRGKLQVVVGDLFEYLRRPATTEYDYAFHDVWQSDSLGTLLTTVLPLRAASVSNGWVKSDARVICWNEDVMRGQIRMGLHSRLAFSYELPTPPNGFDKLAPPTVEELATLRGDKWWDMFVPFFQWVQNARPKKDSAFIAADWYSVVFGQQGWESQWERFTKTVASL